MNTTTSDGARMRRNERQFPEHSGIPEINLKSLRSFDSGIAEQNKKVPR
jgi:hypothetical protein